MQNPRLQRTEPLSRKETHFHMRIYLDTKDLINIFERVIPCGSDEFGHLLRENGHELILSYLNVMEIPAPLVQKNSATNVMRLLNRIERSPIRYISKIFQLELKEGYRAFKGKELGIKS